tara:strand:+ start:74 stop:898 length:825 start_codon:yes stop_codon:yes gene_type:complete
MKVKHNKKRNTAFLFETLIRELTRAVIRKDISTKNDVTSILKEHFAAGTILHEELNLYRSLYETKSLPRGTAERLLSEVKTQYSLLEKKSIFSEQGNVIRKMNKKLSKEVFGTFVPSYKNLATVYQIFNGESAPAKKILLEDNILSQMTEEPPDTDQPLAAQVDNLVIKNFINKFNTKYGDSINESQSRLLQNYILSFTDNAVGLKSFLNEEIGRLHQTLTNGMKKDDIAQDPDMVEKSDKIINYLSEFKNQPFTRDSITQILKIQSLAKEIEA